MDFKYKLAIQFSLVNPFNKKPVRHTGSIYYGDFALDIMEKLHKTVPQYGSLYMLAKQHLKALEIKCDELPKNNFELAEKFFEILVENGYATYAFKDNTLYKPFKLNIASGELFVAGTLMSVFKKNISEEEIERRRQRMNKFHEERRNNPEMAKEIAKKAHACRFFGMTDEEKRQAMRDLAKKSREWRANLSPEEREERRRKRSEMMKERHAHNREVKESMMKNIEVSE